MCSIKNLAIAGGMVMAIGGCTSDDKATIEVAGHIFRIPKEHLIQGIVPWLPASQSAGLKFTINPLAEPNAQMIVTVEPASTTCDPKTLPASNQLASACVAALQSSDSKRTAEHFKVDKILRDGDVTQWEYRMKENNRIVASCYSLDNDGNTGLCTSVNNYKNLIYSIGLRDSDIDHLPNIFEKVDEMLSSWEIKSK